LNLNHLSTKESLKIISYLLGNENFDTDLEDFIWEKTEGVPLFIEEFMKLYKDLGLIEKKDEKYFLIKNIKAVSIPSTIQDVIMARADKLSDVEKEILQAGSTIEREYSYDLIKWVTDISEAELLSALSDLKDSEFLYERGLHPQKVYIFNHALTREVIYDSILSRKKKKLHEKIGEGIEKLYSENIDEYYEVLAEHFIKSENYEKGSEYSKLASKKAFKSASINDAIEYSRKRISCLENLPQNEDVQKKIIEARTLLGLSYIQINWHIEAQEAIAPIIDLAKAHGYMKRLSQIYIILGTYYCFVLEDFPTAFKYLEDALKISEDINDLTSSSQSNYWLSVALSLNCKFNRASNCIKKVLDLNIALNSLWGISFIKGIISYYVYFLQGQIRLAYQTSEEALRIAKESGDIHSLASTYTYHGICCYGMGFFEKAKKSLLKGVSFCERINFFTLNALAQTYLSEICIKDREFQEAIAHLNKNIWLLEQNKFIPSWISLCQIGMARAKIMVDKEDVNLELLDGYVPDNKLKIFDGWMPRYIGEILLHIDIQHLAESEDWIKKAIEADKTNGMIFHLGKDYSLYAELLKSKGEPLKAKEKLNKAIEIFKECGADGWKEKAIQELASLS